MHGVHRRVLLCFIALIFSSSAIAYTELELDFSYDKQIYGDSRDNYIQSRTYSLTMARYFSRSIALEINYSDITRDQSENDEIPISDSDISLTSANNKMVTRLYGAGLRFVFGSRESFFLPMFSLGYAVQEVEDYTDYTFKNNTSGASFVYHGDTSAAKESSIFGSFALKIKLSQRFSLKGSIKTVFPSFELDKAKDYLQYMVGFSCIL